MRISQIKRNEKIEGKYILRNILDILTITWGISDLEKIIDFTGLCCGINLFDYITVGRKNDVSWRSTGVSETVKR